MSKKDAKSYFLARLHRPESSDSNKPWAFVILPKNASAKLPRRGRTTVDGTMNGQVTWENTTTVARLDWIHWITSANQSKTRAKRIDDACEMLAAGRGIRPVT